MGIEIEHWLEIGKIKIEGKSSTQNKTNYIYTNKFGSLKLSIIAHIYLEHKVAFDVGFHQPHYFLFPEKYFLLGNTWYRNHFLSFSLKVETYFYGATKTFSLIFDGDDKVRLVSPTVTVNLTNEDVEYLDDEKIL